MSDQLFGVLLGGFFALAGVFLQRQWARQDQRREQELRERDHERLLKEHREAEVRARVDDRADRVLILLRELEALVLGKVRLGPYISPSDPDESREMRRLLGEILHESNYLTKPLRRHVIPVVHILPDADRLVQERWIEDRSARSVTWSAVRGARRALGRHLRGEPVAPELGEPVATYLEAWQDLQDMIEHQIEAELEEQGDGTTVG